MVPEAGPLLRLFVRALEQGEERMRWLKRKEKMKAAGRSSSLTLALRFAACQDLFLHKRPCFAGQLRPALLSSFRPTSLQPLEKTKRADQRQWDEERQRVGETPEGTGATETCPCALSARAPGTKLCVPQVPPAHEKPWSVCNAPCKISCDAPTQRVSRAA